MPRVHIVACAVLIACALAIALLPGCTTRPAAEEVVLDHFKCYVAEGEIPQRDETVLRDQFRIERGVQIAELRYFCNPVTKVIDGKERPAYEDEDHLTCYSLKPQDPFPALVGARNQFGETELRTGKSELLCVPTVKHGFEKLPSSSYVLDPCPGAEGCCCNMDDGTGTMWPDCDPGLECRRANDPNHPNDSFQVCVPAGSPPGMPLQIHPSQPAYCRY